MNRSFDLRVTPDEKANLTYHLQENGSSIDEMAGFLAAAPHARLFWDVGAHKGIFALFFCSLGADKTAVAFEPSRELRARATELGAMNNLNDRIEWNGSAVGDRIGTTRFALQNTGFLTVAGGDAPTVDVELTTLDAEWKRRGSAPDLLKIDVEGFEWEALQGARELLASEAPALFLELHLQELEQRRIAPRNVVDLLADLGYTFRSALDEPLRPREIFDSLDPIVRFVATTSSQTPRPHSTLRSAAAVRTGVRDRDTSSRGNRQDRIRESARRESSPP